MKKNLVKYRYSLIALVATSLFVFYFAHVFSVTYTSHVPNFQAQFSKLEKQLDAFLVTKTSALTIENTNNLWKKPENDKRLNLHVYKNDSLIYWSTNQLPILQFADIHFPSEGIIHLQNGWYYAKTIKKKELTICGSFLIKHDFSYENKALTNTFVAPLSLPFDAGISLEQLPEMAIHSLKNDFLFSIEPSLNQSISENESLILLLLLVSSILFTLLALINLNASFSRKWQWILPLAVVLIRFLSLKYEWFSFLKDTQAFQASLYGANEWFPNFFEYIFNCLIITFLFLILKQQLLATKTTTFRKIIGIGLFLLNYFLWGSLLYLNKGLIENSSIPLIIEHLFSLNSYSIIAISSIGLLFYVYFSFTKDVIRFNKDLKTGGASLALISFVGGILFFLYQINLGTQLVFSALFPLILNGLLIFLIYRDSKRIQFVYGLVFLALFSTVAALNLSEFNFRKEKSERELYANKLSIEQDIVTEIEFSNLKNKLINDNVLKRFSDTPLSIGLSDFEDGLERRLFNGYWERYEMSFNVFDSIGHSLVTGGEEQKNAYYELNEIISHHGRASEIDSNIYYITDYMGQYSYLIKLPLVSEHKVSATLFCTLKSKKIPEEIGFPRLLISSKAQVFESLEIYSIAKYHDGRLVNNYGAFNYPTATYELKNWQKESENFYSNDGYSHYILKKSKNDIIVLSSKSVTSLEILTSFSYLFSFYGLLLLPLLFQFNYSPIVNKTISLAVKIQLVLIGLIFVSLLAFGWGSGVFVSNQYNEYTTDVIREKLKAVEMELKTNIGNKNLLTISKDGNKLESLLLNFSKVFVTDINLYDTHGFLIASSRPKVFNMGLLSEQMNPEAIFSLRIKTKSEYIHEEKIGNLKYASAYLPFSNHDGRLLGYVNLQHFGQQKDFENQIQSFLVAIINVFMLLLAVSIVFAIFISNWVTTPLRLLQENFASIRFGKHNQQISYNKDDEIGALVKNYNQKLEELEFTAQQLAKSERESAWREMAKQVAHEIKNPLTPMKLSIQQLLRVYDPNDPNSKAKLERVSNSIIEQIDALANIANEFSNFAKMPHLIEKKMDLLPILLNIIEVFNEEAASNILLVTELKEINVNADKDQLIRTFNNLIKNALQAIPENVVAKIEIRIKREEKHFRIEIKDNGIGISKEKQSKIFVPYFTTKTTGTGLGLAMVKQIIENHNGAIYFETEEGVGTTFIIEFPEAI